MTAPRSSFPACLRKLSILVCAASLAACGQQTSSVHRSALSPVSLEVVDAKKVAPQPDRTLAYEHTVSVELPKDVLPARVKEVESSCGSRTELACTLLDVSLAVQTQVPTGRVRMRLAPSAVDLMIAIATKGGRITMNNTHGEDLAQPIADTDRQLALLSTHRDRLGEFLKRKDLTVEQVIALSREISSAQTQIDSLATQQANLRRRVDTQLLELDFYIPTEADTAPQTPAMDAIRSFNTDFRQALAAVIRATAFLLPWLIILVAVTALATLYRRRVARRALREVRQ
jgi:hypothetical protein